MKNTFWKGKKVTAYVALKHHTRFIIPIMDALAALGAQTHYLVGQAERSQEITTIECGVSYNHVFDFVHPEDRDKVYQHYHMLRKTFGQALLEKDLFSLQAPTVLDKTLFAVAQEYVGFKNYLSEKQPDICLSLHELNRWGRMFSFHAKTLNIPHIVLQEGLLSSANFILTGHVQSSCFCLVWGEGTRRKLIEFEAPGDRIIPAGNTHLANEIKRLSENKTREAKRKAYAIEDKFVITLFFSIKLPQDVKEFVELIQLPVEEDHVELFVKFHPGTTRQKIDEFLAKFPKKTQQKVHGIHGEEDTYCLIAMSDLCVLVEGSTIGPETLAIGTPLVLLNLEYQVDYVDPLLIENQAALQMTVKELCTAICNGESFNTRMNKEGVKKYLDMQMVDTENSIDRVISIMKDIVIANKSLPPVPIKSSQSSQLDHTIIIPVTTVPDAFLATLKTISSACGDKNYEVILLPPASRPESIDTILNSLSGDVTILENKEGHPLPSLMNLAAKQAKGEMLSFLDPFIIPEAGWLDILEESRGQYGPEAIFGGQLTNTYGNILHAGMVVNANAQPVSAYLHLNADFPEACQTRRFQMVDYQIALTRELFLELGGFHPASGCYKYLDLCLRATEEFAKDIAVYYLHNLKFSQIISLKRPENHNEAIYFYGRWNGTLWDNEDQLYAMDGISNHQLATERMKRAQELINRV
ncbi:MAG TPA: hypothetical protein DHV36_23720 [Desulfobacteraceae bacterium]|nr:hypothetical protein [Desulfobacteraceae bacterium]|tara:strand:+ start:613 stop:2703 length:2091 start_codon:yes stop_codon:yes gene_type:complete